MKNAPDGAKHWQGCLMRHYQLLQNIKENFQDNKLLSAIRAYLS